MNTKRHWEKIYSTKPPQNLGWYQPHLRMSLSWIQDLALPKDAQVIDIGGGASTLVDDLTGRGYRSITVLDLSEKALLTAQDRLGNSAGSITWLEGDVTTIELPSRHYDLWHDRAVFHFLVSPEEQAQYREKLLHSLRPGGYVIMATFSKEAPPTCSGLPVKRYSHDLLAKTLGDDFTLIKHDKNLHVTPGGLEQMYLYCLFRKSTPERE